MFNFFKKKPKKPEPNLSSGLKKTRSRLLSGLERVFLGKRTIDKDLLSAIETQLIMADVGLETTQHIIDNLTQQVQRQVLKEPEALMEALTEYLISLVEPYQQPLIINDQTEGHQEKDGQKKPFTVLVVGVNGAGKTTSLGKLACHLQNQGLSVLLAAGDTFRAAAIDQLLIWGERNAIPVIAQQPGSDAASVIFDAMQAAQARNIDVVLADTAGRLHTQSHLMDELTKVKRVMQKFDPEAPQETLLVLDASMGQNALEQAKQFQQAIDVSGIILTKLDGTAKGGIVFAIVNALKLPIRYIGVGESLDDLQPFDARTFVEALFYE